jgi:hypothetical protein
MGLVSLLDEHVLPNGGQGFKKVFAFLEWRELSCLRAEGCQYLLLKEWNSIFSKFYSKISVL